MSDTKDSSSDSMPAPSSVPEKASEQIPDKMAAVRQAKKRKAQEDRDVLSDLKKQVGSLADAMSSKPEVVTKQKDEETSVPSLSTEFFRTAVVGLLGIGVFYFNNVWGKRPRLTAPTPAAAAPAPTPPTPPVAPTPPPTPSPTPVAPKAAPTHFIDMKPKRKIGASGLLE